MAKKLYLTRGKECGHDHAYIIEQDIIQSALVGEPMYGLREVPMKQGIHGASAGIVIFDEFIQEASTK